MKFALKKTTKSAVFYRLHFGEVCPENSGEISAKSADFSGNLSLKIPRNLTFSSATYQKPCNNKRLIYKQFVQVSGPCGPQFLSYLPKHFTHHYGDLYGDAIFVYSYGTQILPPEINKNIWRSLFL